MDNDYYLPAQMKNKNFAFDFNLQTTNFTSFRNSIAEGFYNEHGYRDTIGFVFDMSDGDNVVNNQSQLGVKFSNSGAYIDKVTMYKTFMNIDTFEGHNLQNSFHNENPHRREVVNRITGLGLKYGVKGFLED